VKPDVMTLGKSLGGGFMPVSAVLANDNIMNVWEYGEHASTYAANPLALALAKRSVEVLLEDKMIENAEKLGNILAEEMRMWKENYNFIVEIQCGRGLFASVKFTDTQTVWAIGRYVMEKGVLVRAQFGDRLKIMPPLCITEEELREGLKIFREGMEDFKKCGTNPPSG
jgi:ornithine--oxo-acid transaminase